MKRNAIVCLLWLAGSVVYAQDGYVHGENHCFYFSTPDSWVADPDSGANQGLAFVFYPRKESWSSATTVIYARVADKSGTVKTAADQVAATLKQFRNYGSPDIKAEKVSAFKTTLGEEGELYKFTGDSYGNTELVAYFNGRETINFFVMTSRDAADLKMKSSVLQQLARSYREADDCVPCSEKPPQASSDGMSSCMSKAHAPAVQSASISIGKWNEMSALSESTAEGKAYKRRVIQQLFSNASFMGKCAPPGSEVVDPFTLYFEIGEDGLVSAIAADPQTPAASCMIDAIRERSFEAPEKAHAVKLEMRFK
ncbi:MAG TPA: hypothetical protein VF268_12745 [Gammaproteobacteria bacterium]